MKIRTAHVDEGKDALEKSILGRETGQHLTTPPSLRHCGHIARITFAVVDSEAAL